MTKQQQLLELIQECRRTLEQEAKKSHFIRASQTLHAMCSPEIKKEPIVAKPQPLPKVPATPKAAVNKTQSAVKMEAAPLASPEPIHPDVSKKPVQIQPIAKPPIAKPAEQETKQEAKATPAPQKISAEPTPFSLQILPHVRAQKPVVTLAEIEQKLKKLFPQLKCIETASDREAKEKADAWMKKFPLIAFVSFSPRNSPFYPFLQTVAEATSSKIARAKLYDGKDLSCVAELITLIRTSAIRHLIVAYEERMQKEVDAFLHHFEIAESKQQGSILQERGKAHTAIFYHLAISDTLIEDVQAKAQLWNALKSL